MAKKPLFPARRAQIITHKQYLAAKLAPSIPGGKKPRRYFFAHSGQTGIAKVLFPQQTQLSLASEAEKAACKKDRAKSLKLNKADFVFLTTCIHYIFML